MAKYFSLIGPVPGFTERNTVEARDLRGEPFAFLLPSLAPVSETHAALVGKIAGILVTVEATSGCTLVAEGLWHRKVLEAEVPLLRELLEPWVQLIEAHRVELRNGQKLSLEVERARADRTRLEARLSEADRQVHVVLENTGDALLICDLSGRLEPTASSLAFQWFGPPKGRMVAEYLFPDEPRMGAMMELGLEQLRDKFLLEDLLLEQLPSVMQRGARTYHISPRPIREGGELVQLLLVVSDCTERLAREAAEREAREDQAIVMAVVQDRESFARGLDECRTLMNALSDGAEMATAKRLLHTLKGNSAIMGFLGIASMCHGLEDTLASDPDMQPDTTLLWPIEEAWSRIERRVARLVPDLHQRRIEIGDDEYRPFLRRLSETLPEGDVLRRAQAFQLAPTAKLLHTMARSVERIARRLGKSVHVEIDPHGVRLHSTYFGPFLATLVHVVRNCLDHGIESAEERVRGGKSPVGTLTLATELQGDTLTVSLGDDGRGIDWARVRDKARTLGIPCAAEEELVAALFADGMTTSSSLTEISGRGIGLSAVLAAVLERDGSVEVESKPQEGTTFRFHFPVRWLEGIPVAGSALSVAPPPIVVAMSEVPVCP